MNVIAHDPMVAADDAAWLELEVKNRSLEALLAESDVVSLHVPLIAQTRGMLNASRIALMKRGAIVINSARGGIVDESAVVNALRTGALAVLRSTCSSTNHWQHAPPGLTFRI